MLILAAGIGWLRWRPAQVDVISVTTQALIRSLQFSARVATSSRVDVGSTLTGRVIAVPVEEGAFVKKGDVLLRLDPEELSAALSQSLAAEHQAKARLEGLRTTGRQSVVAGLLQADANLRVAETELQRTQELVQKGFVSTAKLEDARRAVEVARAQRLSAQAQIQSNDEAGSELRQTVAQFELARAASQAARARLAQSVITAPADARVLARSVEPGQIVQPGRSLMNLALAGPSLLIAQVDERFLEQLQAGQAASVVADAFAGQSFAAKVLSISPAVDPQRGTVEVKFALTPPVPTFLREDMTLSVEVATARREAAKVLPLSALRSSNREGSATVWIVDQDKVAVRQVQLGLRTLDSVDVTQGLQPGDLIVVGGKAQLGDRVRVQQQAWKSGQGAASVKERSDAASALSNSMGR